MMSDAPRLTLYCYETCYYCVRVRRVIDRLGTDIAVRDTIREPDARRELIEATGRKRVPVLRIDHPDGRTEWMPESRAIIRYLEAL